MNKSKQDSAMGLAFFFFDYAQPDILFYLNMPKPQPCLPAGRFNNHPSATLRIKTIKQSNHQTTCLPGGRPKTSTSTSTSKPDPSQPKADHPLGEKPDP